MIRIEDYIKLDQSARQEHLALDEPCIEIGGNSTQFKGLLAHFLGTTIPKKSPYLCHACHNGGCSNPRHLYWGTHGENEIDAFRNGKVTAHQATVVKYGIEQTRNMKRTKTTLLPGQTTSNNKGVPKSPEHKAKISESLKKRFSQSPNRLEQIGGFDPP